MEETLLDPRTVADRNYPGWYVVHDQVINYDYGSRQPKPASLQSNRESRLYSDIPGEIKERLQHFPEFYVVDTNESNTHGAHWHPNGKTELMTIVRGRWELRLKSPFGYEDTVIMDKSVAVIVMPGTWHEAIPLVDDSILLVHSTREFKDGEVNDSQDWLEDL